MYQPTEPSTNGRRSSGLRPGHGARNTSHEKKKETSPKKDKSFWKTQTNGGTGHPYLKNVTSPERERINEDGSFLSHQKGPSTADWFLRQGDGREILREWMKMTSVRSQDQRRMLQSTSHSFPSNVWIHKITKGKESDECDLYKALRIAEDRFTTRMHACVCCMCVFPCHFSLQHSCQKKKITSTNRRKHVCVCVCVCVCVRGVRDCCEGT